jgi:hypothetical protein
MDAYLVGSPAAAAAAAAASPRGKIRLFGSCQFHNMTNLHLEFWSQLPSKLWDPHMHSLPPVPLFQWSILVQNQTCLLNKISLLLHFKNMQNHLQKMKDWEKHLPSLSGVTVSGFSHLLNFPAHPDSPPIPSAHLLQVVGSWVRIRTLSP